MLVTYETSFTMRGETEVTLQHHQILRLPRKMTLMILVTYETSFTMRGAAEVTLQHHQILLLPRKMTMRGATEVALQHHQILRLPRKWLSWLILVTYETSFTMRGETEVTLQHHQKLLLPRKMTLMIDPRYIWNVIYNSLTNNGCPPTSANTAPATINDSHDWSSGHMKRNARSNRGCPPTSPNTAPATKNDSHHLQCAEQQRLPSNITKYCSCHEKWLSWLILGTYETSFTMHGATEVALQHHQILRLPRKWLSWLILVTYETSFTMRGETEVTLQHRQILRLPRKMTLMILVLYEMKRHLQCAEQPRLPSNITKNSSCHEKWLWWLILVTYETSFTIPWQTTVALQHQQILRLPR